MYFVLYFNQEYPHIKAIFVVGLPSGSGAHEAQWRIRKESRMYGDILQVQNVLILYQIVILESFF